MKKEKIYIIAIILFGLFALSFSVYKIYTKYSNKNEVEDVYDTAKTEEKEEGISSNDETNPNEAEFVTGTNNTYFPKSMLLGDNKSDEYSQTESNLLYNELIKDAGNADYQKIINRVNEIKSNYKFTAEYNWKICKVYSDAVIMVETLSTDVDNQPSLVKDMKDPQMLLIGVLFLAEEQRRSLIIDADSLSPIFDGTIIIDKTEKIDEGDTDIDYMSMKSSLSSVMYYYRVYFSVNGNNLIAYMAEYNNACDLYKITTTDESLKNVYRTVRYWQSIDDKFLNKAKQSSEGGDN